MNVFLEDNYRDIKMQCSLAFQKTTQHFAAIEDMFEYRQQFSGMISYVQPLLPFIEAMCSMSHPACCHALVDFFLIVLLHEVSCLRLEVVVCSIHFVMTIFVV